MSIGMSEDLRNARLNQIAAAMDAGTGAGLLNIYNGSRPDTGGNITTQILLAQLTLSSPSAPGASGGVLTLDTITSDSSANATGVANWARITDGDGLFVMDLDVGSPGSGADIELVNVNIIGGNPVAIAVATITEGNA